MAILLLDVIDASTRNNQSGTQSSKRDLIRAIFAAIEGVAWVFRQHVIEAAKLISELEVEEEIVLAETSYQVSDQGKISAQSRYLSLVATIRLTARIAAKLTPATRIDFSGRDWDGLQQAMRTRNRITHPKQQLDLELSDDDIDAAVGALFWFVAEAERVMTAANIVVKDWLGNFQEVLTELKAGNPEVLAEYHAAGAALRSKDWSV